jgi:hypothetical protein
MAYPLATPFSGSTPSPAYSGTFIPEIWTGKLIEKFYDATVFAAMANTDYEGEIKNQGDKVKIRTKPTIVINPYEADQALVVERPSSAVVDLLIDQGYYFNTVLDDVMEVQADINQMSIWADDASEQMKIQIDTECLAYVITDVSADNQGATAGRISSAIDLGDPTGAAAVPLELVGRAPAAGATEVIDVILRLGQALDEQNIPESNRWIIIPAWMAAMVKRSELRDASLSGDGMTMLRNGRLGTIDRFTLYSSNLLPTTGSTAGGDATLIQAGHSHGLTFASQLSKVETLRGESSFGTYLRGLQVYGRKVVDNTALAMASVRVSEV